MEEMKIAGMTYSAIAKHFGVSRQRIQQILKPPSRVADNLRERASYSCEKCKVELNQQGHIHHKFLSTLPLNHLDNLIYLCVRCHLELHSKTGKIKKSRRENMGTAQQIKDFRKSLGLTRKEFAHIVGVRVATIFSWEGGITSPSRMAQRSLLEVQIGIKREKGGATNGIPKADAQVNVPGRPAIGEVSRGSGELGEAFERLGGGNSTA